MRPYWLQWIAPVACALYVGAVTLLFGLYLAAVRLASRLRGSSAHVVVHLCLVRPDVCGDLRLCGPVGGGRAKPRGVLQFQHWVCLWAADSRVPLAPSLLGPPIPAREPTARRLNPPTAI